MSTSPRALGLAAGIAAVALGLVYMALAGAPPRYLLVNAAALALGAIAWWSLARRAVSWPTRGGTAVLAMATAIVATTLIGVAAGGATRWVGIGPVSVQVSLVLLPAMIVLFARRADAAGTVGMIAAAGALALQPDRAMAGVLLAALLAILCAAPGRGALFATAAAGPAFGATWLTPDRLPAIPFVDRVFTTAFDMHPLAGLAVATGAAALAMPAVAGLACGGGRADRAMLAAFGVCWGGVAAAAALGNYPTPLVGYGGSAVLGYLLSAALLPQHGRVAKAVTGAAAPPVGGEHDRKSTPDRRVARIIEV